MRLSTALRTIASCSVFSLSVNANAQTTHHVDVNQLSFSPSTIVVAPGDSIIWNHVSGNHIITSGTNCISDGLYFDEVISASNSEFTWLVPNDAASDIPYFCEPHCGFGMEGLILIQTPDIATSHLATINGSDVLQIAGATSGAVQGGDATSDQRTVYVWGNDNDENPGYNGTAWPLVTADELGNIGAGVEVTHYVNASGHVIVETCIGPRPIYQFRNDNSAATAAGQGLGNIWWTIDPSTGEVNDGTTSCPTACPGDFDEDLIVGLSDFSLFLVAFGTANESIDMDGSGLVDLGDFSLFLINYGNDCSRRSQIIEIKPTGKQPSKKSSLSSTDR